jgi:hypothetical protein
VLYANTNIFQALPRFCDKKMPRRKYEWIKMKEKRFFLLIGGDMAWHFSENLCAAL